MKRFSLLITGLGLCLAAVGAGDEKIKLDGIKCIVAGAKAAKADNSVAYKDGKVFFCCANCPKAFAKETAKFATKANHQLIATGQAKQANCPLTGGEVDSGTEISVKGAKIAFCCNNCKGKAEKAEGDAQLEMLFSDKAFEKAGFKVAKK